MWFIVPAHGRLERAAVCLRQLRRTIDALDNEGVDAAAVVVACDENLDTARQLGFGTVERDNDSVSRRFNDGIQLACDPAFNKHPADYIVTCGSDDWIDHRILLDLPGRDQVRVFRFASIVREDGRELATCVTGRDGWGIRVYPRALLAETGYRPAEEDLRVGCDTSLLIGVRNRTQPVVTAGDLHGFQIVDWKTAGEQIHPYRQVTHHAKQRYADPFVALEGAYPSVALDEMRATF